jgi:serine protease Do
MRMRKNTLIVLLTGLFLSLVAVAAAADMEATSTSPDASQIEAISNAVFEVVMTKPTKDSLQYEKPLPLELLPYSIRTDKYYSVGTAFAIGPSEFVSAAHVMNLGMGSQSKEYFLRDKEGKIYPIDKILKYSSNRDFIIFSLHNAKEKRFLPINMNPRLNQKVYAVGNALGQGIVIRDGLYTSSTPEDEAGEWKWIRFSAAASPGNSGGPLLDEDGNVIGIVLRKSPNENLNYAIPIAEVIQAKTNTALIQMRMRYAMDNMDTSKIGTIKREISLPKTYEKFDGELNAVIVQFFTKLREDLLAENREAIFPRGPGSTRLFYKQYTAVFPHLIIRGKDGYWDAYPPKERKDTDLGNNGRIIAGAMGRTVFMSIQKRDDIRAEPFYDDSKLFMDTILKTGVFLRRISTESIKMTSMGRAVEDFPFTDSYGRVWIIRTWLIEYNDTKVVTFSLPVPGGFMVMMRVDQTGIVDALHIPDLKVLSDFIYVSYSGNFKEWREFLDMKKLLPSIFSTLNIHVDSKDIFRYQSPRLSLFCNTDMMKISDKSYLRLNFDFIPEREKTVWDVGVIRFGEDEHQQNVYTLHRTMKPPKELGDNYRNDWEDRVEQRFPYNRSAYYKDQFTIISTTYGRDSLSGKGNGLSGSVLYTLSFIKKGNVDQKEMESKLALFMRNLVVYENEGVISQKFGPPLNN